MTRSVYVREIYFYIICLVAIILFIVGIASVFDNVFTYNNPVSYMTRAGLIPAYEDRYANYSKEDIEELIEEEIQNSIDNEKTFALKGLIRGSVFILIAVPLFVIHWRKAQVMWRISEEKS